MYNLITKLCVQLRLLGKVLEALLQHAVLLMFASIITDSHEYAKAA